MMVAATPPILDGHNDTLLHLSLPERGGSRSFFTRSERGHIDLPRARDGGFAGGYFAVFVPSDPAAPLGNDADVMRTATGYEVRMAPAIDHAYAQRMTLAMTASLFRLAAESRGQVRVVRTVDELEACLRYERMSANRVECCCFHLDKLNIFGAHHWLLVDRDAELPGDKGPGVGPFFHQLGDGFALAVARPRFRP
jgi:Membrane dipeptidase (Peptidase family M19)